MGGVYNENVNIGPLFRNPRRLDQHAFEAIFNEHYTRVYAILIRLTGDPDSADALTTATFWQLWQRQPGQDEHIAGWLYRAATHMGYNYLLEAWKANVDGQECQARDRVRNVLHQMPLGDVQVLLLQASGLSYKEIAAALEVGANSVGALLACAEARFEALYDQKEGYLGRDS